MKTYEIIKIGNKYAVVYYINGIEESIEFHSLDGINGTIREGYVNINPTNSDKLKCDVDFGNKLISEFLVDNRISPISFNPQLSASVLMKFQTVKALAEVGDIKNVKIMLGYIEVDELFTQERKDKYINMINNYLGL